MDISVHLKLGVEDEAKTIKDFGMISKACMEWGMLILATAYNHSNIEKRIGTAHAARIAEELGTDIIKVEYPWNIDDFQKIIEGVIIPVVISGGETSAPSENLMNINDSLNVGGAGVAIGRNIFQHKDQKFIINLISDLVRNKIDLDKGLKRL